MMMAPDPAHEEKYSPISDLFNPRSKAQLQAGKIMMQEEDQEEHDVSHNSHFPLKLHEMLQWADKEGYDSVVSWLPGEPQNSFKVHRKDEFVCQIMPRFFKQTQYKSFIRQLNLWDFERIVTASSSGKGGYKHDLFSKDNPGLCVDMKRTKIKGKNSKLSQMAKMAKMTARRKLASNNDILSDPDKVNSKGTQELSKEQAADGIAFFSNMEKPNHISPQEMKYVQIGMDLGRRMARGEWPKFA
jgi:heat shock transcription factor